MNTRKILAPFALIAALAISAQAFAQTETEPEEIAKEEQAAQPIADKPDWVPALKEKYNLTDEQIKTMQDKGLNKPHMAFTAQLAKSSGKSIDEVIKMRQEQKMGWGKIAKELGVAPGELGGAVAGMRKDINEKRFEAKHAEKMEARAERKEERKDARRADREAKREARKAARKERTEKMKGNK